MICGPLFYWLMIAAVNAAQFVVGTTTQVVFFYNLGFAISNSADLIFQVAETGRLPLSPIQAMYHAIT